ncbi:hypothetical protein Dda_8334 [Drechslerella dactyloides]|uniref:Uncharacterized protein n=1 Tax=Drechslerella dactyloides TaxID=74499 RepID=A0AAD6IQH2_DREDA|nr:hypothetical protein Dda_8334 [Drechslerella dactyloides]
MRSRSLVLVGLAAAVLASPILTPKPDVAELENPAFPGDAFLRALANTPNPKFATNIPLATTHATTRRHLAAFRKATLELNMTYPVNFLDESHEFQYPAFNDMRCELGKDSNGVVPFTTSSTLGTYFESLFQMIPSWTKGQIALSRFDLFHAHLFANPTTRVAALVFHAKEYPADNADTFPFNLGFCQIGSNLVFVDKIMRRRNLVWIIDANDRTSLWWIDMGVKTGDQAVDAVTGGAPFYTLYEDSLGHVVADFYYLEGLALGVSLY